MNILIGFVKIKEGKSLFQENIIYLAEKPDKELLGVYKTIFK